MLATIDGGIDPAQPLAPPEPCIGLDRPAWADLAEASGEWLLPGVGQLPGNCVIALQSDPIFIDAYLAGLNTQLLAELRWRNIPIATGCTPIRRFWDRTDTPTGARSDDIAGVASWTPDSALGDPAHLAPGATGRELVIAVRGELLLRYPTTLVYLQSAVPPGATTANFDADPDDAAPRVLPGFQRPDRRRRGVLRLPRRGRHGTGRALARLRGTTRRLPVRATTRHDRREHRARVGGRHPRPAGARPDPRRLTHRRRPPMTTDLGVLLPIRIETRFKNGDLWLRVVPDEPWFVRDDPRITPGELDALRRYAAAPAGPPPGVPAAWRDLAAQVGAPRAVYLHRTFITTAADGTLTVRTPAPAEQRTDPALPRITGFPTQLSCGPPTARGCTRC